MQSKNGKTLARGKISSILEKCIYIENIRLNLKTIKIIALEALGCALCQVVFFQHVDVKPSVLFLSAMRQSNCSAPIPPPPGTPGTSLFFGFPGLLITTFLPCLALYKHSNHSFFKCPALFNHLHFSSDLGAAPGG